MRKRTMGNRATIAMITIMWLVTTPAILLFFTRIIRWPWDFTLLMSVPFFMFFIPYSYPIAIAGGELSRRGLRFGVHPQALVRFSVFSLPICLVSLCSVWVYGQLKEGIYFGATIACLIGLISAWAGVRAFRRLLSDMTASDKKPADEP